MIETDLQFVELDRRLRLVPWPKPFRQQHHRHTEFFGWRTPDGPASVWSPPPLTPINAALTTANCKSIYQEHISGASGQEVAFKQGGTLYVPGIPAVPYGVIIKVKPTLAGQG
jgi:hypothetical protein